VTRFASLLYYEAGPEFGVRDVDPNVVLELYEFLPREAKRLVTGLDELLDLLEAWEIDSVVNSGAESSSPVSDEQLQTCVARGIIEALAGAAEQQWHFEIPLYCGAMPDSFEIGGRHDLLLCTPSNAMGSPASGEAFRVLRGWVPAIGPTGAMKRAERAASELCGCLHALGVLSFQRWLLQSSRSEIFDHRAAPSIQVRRWQSHERALTPPSHAQLLHLARTVLEVNSATLDDLETTLSPD
jgi:hypothetical protein